MRKLYMHDWYKHQTYRSDRGKPPWIKIYRDVMTSPKWVMLTEEEKGQLVSMWILAAKDDGWIVADPVIIKRLCYFSSELNLNKFIDLGWIDGDMTSSGCQHDVNVTSTWRQHDVNLTPQLREDEDKGREVKGSEDTACAREDAAPVGPARPVPTCASLVDSESAGNGTSEELGECNEASGAAEIQPDQGQAAASVPGEDRTGGRNDPERPAKSTRPDPVDIPAIIELYNAVCHDLPRVQQPGKRLYAQIRARASERPERRNLNWWRGYFERVQQSDYMNGRVNGFRADLLWITGAENTEKILMGRYDNRKSALDLRLDRIMATSESPPDPFGGVGLPEHEVPVKQYRQTQLMIEGETV